MSSSNDYPIDSNKGTYVNTLFRVDEDLQKIATGEDCQKKFEEKHGSLIVYSPNKRDFKKFIVQPDDEIRPSCTVGRCRSQVTYLIFQLFVGLINRPPHGTRQYLDPVLKSVPWSKKPLEDEAKKDEFENCFELSRVERIGYREFDKLRSTFNPNQEVLDEVETFFKKRYFGPDSVDAQAKRIIHITFAANAHAILYRLNQANEDLSRHIVICLDMDDYASEPPSWWKASSKSVEAFTKTAQLIAQFFDFSQLKLKEFSKGETDPIDESDKSSWVNT